jgi:hypothetical protein
MQKHNKKIKSITYNNIKKDNTIEKLKIEIDLKYIDILYQDIHSFYSFVLDYFLYNQRPYYYDFCNYSPASITIYHPKIY